MGADRSNWMWELYEHNAAKLLSEVAIPGTHNSGTYRLNEKGDLEPGQPPSLGIIKGIVKGWSQTQFRSIYDQLRDGIRFLDLRVAPDKSNNLRIVHGLYGITLKEALAEVARFSDVHPKEIILIRCVFGDGFRRTSGAQKILIDVAVQTALGHRLHKFEQGVRFLDFWETHTSVMVGEEFGGVWPDTTSAKAAEERVSASLSSRDRHSFMQSELILTPRDSFNSLVKDSILVATGRNSLSMFSMSLSGEIPNILHRYRDHGLKPNIISVDFYELVRNFVDDVISFNH